MRIFIASAAALMLGTSAQAWTTMQEDAHLGQVATAAKVAGYDVGAWSGAKAMTTLADASGWDAVKAHAATWADASKADVATDATASAKVATDGGLVWADADIKSKELVGGTTMTASADTALDKTYAGMGGPEESATGYPACSPTVTDRCIQLYERGVRESLAQWKFGADADVAMGGPYEPVADGSAKPADTTTAEPGTAKPAGTASGGTTMSGTGSGHMDHGADSHSDHDMSTGSKPAATSTATPGGVGGPEVRTGYPACSATVTDSCIQLYERGVTGQGN